MKRVAVLLGVIALCVGLLAGLRVATAGQVCVAYKATAPVIGTRQGMPCLPDPFSHPFSTFDCEALPPLGVAACATVSADTP